MWFLGMIVQFEVVEVELFIVNFNLVVVVYVLFVVFVGESFIWSFFDWFVVVVYGFIIIYWSKFLKGQVQFGVYVGIISKGLFWVFYCLWIC